MSNNAVFIIADCQDVTRAGLHSILASAMSECTTVDASTKKELLAALAMHDEAIVVLDYELFDIASIDELLILVRRFYSCRWILFSNTLNDNIVQQLSGEGNISMMLKGNSADEIRSALVCALHKERFLCHQISNRLIATDRHIEPRSPLTAAEIDVLRLIAHGKSVKEIAEERRSSVHTIVTHKKNIFRKLNVNNVHEATKYAIHAGLVEVIEYYI